MGTREAVLTSTHNLCFDQKYEKYQIFLSENFQFLEVKFSIYLNRHFCAMDAHAHADLELCWSYVFLDAVTYFMLVFFLL